MSLAERYAKPKKVDPRLIKPRKDHTLNSFSVDKALLPYVILVLISDIKLPLVRAMNYARILYVQMETLALYEVIDFFLPLGHKGLDALDFYLGVAPSTFNRYAYWYSRFLFHAIMFNKIYGGKYKYLYNIDMKLVRMYLFSEARRGLKPCTVKVIYQALKHMLGPFERYFTFLFARNFKIKSLFKTLYTLYGYPRKKKVQLTYYIMVKILEIVNLEKLIDVRDWVLLVFAKIAGFRGSAITSSRWDDLFVKKYHDPFRNKSMDLLVLFLDSTKTVAQKDGQVVTISVESATSAFNLVSLLLHYIKLLKENDISSIFIFPSLSKNHRGSQKHINVNTMTKQLKSLYKRAGGDPAEISSHSARGGMVEDAVAAGIPARLIKSLGRWKSQCWTGYFHDEEYAMASATSTLNQFAHKFDTQKSSKKHKELCKLLRQLKY